MSEKNFPHKYEDKKFEIALKKLLQIISLNREEILKLVEKKNIQFKGLITKTGLLFILSRENNWSVDKKIFFSPIRER